MSIENHFTNKTRRTLKNIKIVTFVLILIFIFSKNVLAVSETKSKVSNKVSTESQLELAQSLLEKEYSFAATDILSNLIKNNQGTQISFKSLSLLEEIYKKYFIDEDAISRTLLVDIEYENLPKDFEDFVRFHQGVFYLRMGQDQWARNFLSKVSSHSYWGYLIKLNSLLDSLSELSMDPNKLDTLISQFESLSKEEKIPETIRQEVLHDYARLLFEKFEFEKSYDIFKKIELDPRDRGVLLLERAWAKYYLKDYSKALGLLTALEAPIFDASRSGEVYILQMLIYKELCYFNSALTIKEEFNSRFSEAIESIRKRKNLKKNKTIINLSVLDKTYRKSVNYLNGIKRELHSFSKSDFNKNFLFKELKRKYQLKIKEIYARMDYILENKVREVAEQLLDWDEQISYLDYQINLDKLRLSNAGVDTNFQTEEVPHMKFDKIYWGFSGEFWLEELENLTVLIDNKCRSNKEKK